jgi:hypothetical protein
MKLIDPKARRSGETVKKRGLYTSNCCGNERTFAVGDSYTRCLECMSLCVWESAHEPGIPEERNHIAPIAA